MRAAAWQGADSMRAVMLHAFGGPEVLRLDTVPLPAVGAGDLLVRVVAASYNPIDAKIRGGAMSQALRRPLPVVMGWDVAGIVVSVGEAVTHFAPGDSVYAFAEFGRGGTWAEYVAVDAAQVARKPTTIAFAHAAALPMAGQAAWQGIVIAGAVTAGQRVLVHGGAGGVGAIAVQLAAARGAHVIATSSASDAALVSALGASEVRDYRAARPLDGVRDIDLVLDTIGGATQEASWATLRPGGLLVATAQPPAPGRAEAAGVRAQFVVTPPDGAVLHELAALVDSGHVRSIVGAEMALEDAAAAHAMAERGEVRGKLVMHVGRP